MASPNSIFTELVSTTFRKHRKEIKDNISNRNAFHKYMMKKGNKRKEDGGLTIACPLDYAENGTYQRYSDWDILDISASEVISAAEYQWRQIALNVVASGRELRINSGEAKIINLAKSRIKNALRTFNNNFSSDLYSDGTASNQINGLQSIIADSGQGTVGGIDSSTAANAFWRNTVQSAAAPIQGGGAVTVSETTIENEIMLPLWLELDRGSTDTPDLIVMSNDYYQFYENSQVSNKRYMDADKAQGGFVSLKYKTADVMHDGNSGISAAHGYMINTDYFGLCVHKDADLEIMEDQRPINQEGTVTPMIWMGNLECSNRAQQGVFKA